MEYTYNILDEVYNWMLSKEKDVEVRLLKEKSSMINVDDYITFHHIDKPNKMIKVKVIKKNIFDNINDLLKVYDSNRIMPNHTKEDLIELINKIYGNELVNGKLVAFEFIYL